MDGRREWVGAQPPTESGSAKSVGVTCCTDPDANEVVCWAKERTKEWVELSMWERLCFRGLRVCCGSGDQ